MQLSAASAWQPLPRYERLAVIAALVLASSLAWWYLLAGAGMGMSAADMTRMVYGDHSVMRDALMRPAVWTPDYALLMFFMWWVMMIAMMLPSAVPVVLLAAAVNRHHAARQPAFGRTQGFVLGYLLAWAGFSVLATIAQWQLQALGQLSVMTLQVPRGAWAAALLLFAALWQCTPYKQACLRQCRAPAQWLVAHRHRPAVVTGLLHGAYCVGCCWLLMALLFVGGVMNLFWIAGLAVLVLAEKILPGGRVTSAAVALALGAAAITMIMR